jgi:glycosyltransferase involved in cell wall biosynthesis
MSLPTGEGASSGHPLRILFLTTRDLGQRATGRVTVLRTHVNALEALGHEVTLAVVAPRAPRDSEWTQRFRTAHVHTPRLTSVAGSALGALSGGELSLNEVLFVDRSVRRGIAGLVAALAPDVVVLDTLRLYSAVSELREPVVVDLDDLLSVRYAGMGSVAGADAVGVLGFIAERVPVPLRTVAARGAVRLLHWESRRIAARELAVCAAAAAVGLVSRREMDALTARSGRDIAWLPPAVPLPAEPVEQRDGLVFLGGLDYLPNLQALRFYRDAVLPHLDPADPRHVLHVVGHCPDAARAEFDVPGMVLHGYVDDLGTALSRRILVAPLLDGGGLKLKVLQAMAHGLPVVGTPQAFEGLDLPAELALQRESGAELGSLLRALAPDVDRCRRLGLAARELVARTFSERAAANRWSALLMTAAGPATSALSGQGTPEQPRDRRSHWSGADRSLLGVPRADRRRRESIRSP